MPIFYFFSTISQKPLRYGIKFSLLVVITFCLPLRCLALSPSEVLVVANAESRHSTALARYYQQRRGIPSGNLLVLQVSDQDLISREDYETRVAEPLRRFLAARNSPTPIRCLVTMYGVPLRIAEEGAGLKKSSPLRGHRLAMGRPSRQGREETAQQERTGAIRSAALDSELALVLKQGYLLDGWISNPYFLGFGSRMLPTRRDEVLWVSRLDGPSPQLVRRIIEDSLAAEAKGLDGRAYFDARWPKSPSLPSGAYAFYDNSIHLAAERLQRSGRLPVKLNDGEDLFQAGEAPEAGIYCGWYRLGSYLDAFEWRPGAVGYHIASGECATLRGETRGWCRGMLEDGAAATVGPVAEPYVQAFPVPEIFFGLLIDGYYSLAEIYFLSTPYLSWQMVLIGDPLYRPFKNAKGTAAAPGR